MTSWLTDCLIAIVIIVVPATAIYLRWRSAGDLDMRALWPSRRVMERSDEELWNSEGETGDRREKHPVSHEPRGVDDTTSVRYVMHGARKPRRSRKKRPRMM